MLLNQFVYVGIVDGHVVKVNLLGRECVFNSVYFVTFLDEAVYI